MNNRTATLRAMAALLILAGLAPAVFAGGKPEVGAKVSAAQAYEIYAAGDALMVDVRDTESYVSAHIVGAWSVPLSTVRARAAELSADGRTIITYCSCPAEESSLAAAADLIAAGVTNVLVLQGGIAGWVEAGHPLKRGNRP